MRDDILNLLDNKDNWDISKDGDKVTFKLKKTEEFKNLVIKEHLKKFLKEVKFTEFEYTVEYVYNKKNKKLDKLFYEIVTATDSSSARATTRGTLEDPNKEIKIELPEVSKKAKELKEKKEQKIKKGFTYVKPFLYCISSQIYNKSLNKMIAILN